MTYRASNLAAPLRLLAVAILVLAALALGLASAADSASAAGVVTWGGLPEPVPGLDEVVEVSAGSIDAARLADGTVVAWSPGSHEAPTPISGLSEVIAISSGAEDILALRRNGTVMAFGSNSNGGLGDGSTEESALPVEVSGLSEVVAVSAGGEANLALLRDGTVKAWGTNHDGELGDGTFTGPETCGSSSCSTVPVTVKGLSGVTAIDAGAYHNLALLADGTVRAWGLNGRGELGDGEFSEHGASKNEPVPVVELDEVTAISAGYEESIALLSDGTAKTWGDNRGGQLGDPSVPNGRHFEDVSVNHPVPVSELSEAVEVSAGGTDDMALLRDGTVVDWGENEPSRGSGLGTGASGPEVCELFPEGHEPEPLGPKCSKVPVVVYELTGVSQISEALEGEALAAGPLAERVTSVTPNAGAGNGGTEVTITGTNLSGASEVRFGASDAAAFTVLSSTSIAATAPPGSGVVDVRVTTPEGTTPVTPLDDRFDYAPTLASVEPSEGPEAGGTAVTIVGSNFRDVTGVDFGSTPATSFKVDSPTSITAESPAGTGSVDVSVTSSGGTSPTNAGDVFRYVARPTVTSLEPASGPVKTRVTIVGTNLQEVLEVRFGSTPATGIIVREYGSSISAEAPRGVSAVDVTVRTAGGASATNAGDVFTYVPSGPAPTVTKLLPKKGPTTGGTSVSVTGTNLAEAVAVYFGSTPAASFTVNSGQSITAVAPSSVVGTVDVTVQTTGGTSTLSSKDHFKYEGLLVEGVSPSSGPAAGGTHVTVTGEGFAPGSDTTQFLFKKTAASAVNCASTTSCVMVAPAGKVGTVDVRAIAGGKKSKVNRPADQYRYE
jgi:alpha-tubulin suppressor-like RCC1 family protein